MAIDPVAVRLSEAGIALLAAQTGDPRLRRAARRRFRTLVAPPVQRLLNGRSIRSVAEEAGIHYSTLARVLKGQGDLFTAQARRLAKTLGLDLLEVFAYLERVQSHPLKPVR